MIYVDAMYACEVGEENDDDVLSYEDLCQCSRMRLGGTNIYTPWRAFKPVYVNQPLISGNIREIRDHYGLNCIGKVLSTMVIF